MLLRSFVDGLIFGEIQAGGIGDELWVLLHGWGRSMGDFSAFCSLVPGDGPWVARFDLPGFGSSPRPESAFGSSGYAKVVSGAIRQVVSQMPNPDQVRVIAVGHSLGGRVALALSAEDSLGFDLAGVVISGVPLLRSEMRAGKPKLAFRIARSLSRARLLPDSTMDRFRSKYGSTDYRNSDGVMREVLVRLVNEDYTQMLEGLKVPLEMLWGQDDKAAPAEMAERAALISSELIELQIVPGDHFVAITSPGILLDSVGKLVQRTGK